MAAASPGMQLEWADGGEGEVGLSDHGEERGSFGRDLKVEAGKCRIHPRHPNRTGQGWGFRPPLAGRLGEGGARTATHARHRNQAGKRKKSKVNCQIWPDLAGQGGKVGGRRGGCEAGGRAETRGPPDLTGSGRIWQGEVRGGGKKVRMGLSGRRRGGEGENGGLTAISDRIWPDLAGGEAENGGKRGAWPREGGGGGGRWPWVGWLGRPAGGGGGEGMGRRRDEERQEKVAAVVVAADASVAALAVVGQWLCKEEGLPPPSSTTAGNLERRERF